MLSVLQMFFTSFDKLSVVEGLPSFDLTPASSILCLVSSSPSPLSANTSCTTAFALTAAIWAMVSVMYD